MPRPLLSLSLDLDDKWSYLKTHGDPAWAARPSYLPVVVPRILDLLAEAQVRVTVFVVGEDAAKPRNRELLRAIAAAGHEIANHSYRHDPWLQRYSDEEFDAELARAEAAIGEATGERPVGFRGPGFSLCASAPRVLARRGYLYDGSTFPTFLGPLARAYMFFHSRYTAEEKRQRRALFGSLRDLRRPNTAHVWRQDGAAIVEIPVTVLPFVRVPIHATYVMYLAAVSERLAAAYGRFALAACRASGVDPSFLLHPVDFIDVTDAPEMTFFPSMRVPVAAKRRILLDLLRTMRRRFEVVTMRQHAATVAASRAMAIPAAPVRASRAS